uniref:Myb/SANT-like domain-containing protein n=1 Tax=Setaria viridis TaxID=4556 RepID=A0A4V6D2M7_SETVI|nr:hypothetical protein SEVIR_8G035500v2 [Setaria viridis]
MASSRANWDEKTMKTFLDLCIAEKNQLNWSNKCLTKLGWQHFYRGVCEATPSMGTEDTPADMYLDPMATSNARNMSKRSTQEEVVDSPPKKKSGSLEDYVRELSETVATRSQKRLSREQEDLDLAMRILEEDGIDEGSDLYCMAIYLCKNVVNRRAFTKMKTREGCLHWIQFNWERENK